MYSIWQVSGGKIEEGELSVQAALREIAEETGISLSEKDLTFLFNDSTYNCDVYNAKLLSNQIPQHMKLINKDLGNYLQRKLIKN